MSKFVIVLFAVLATVATNASGTAEDVRNYHQNILNQIDEQKKNISQKYESVVHEYYELKKHFIEQGKQVVVNSDIDIMHNIERARRHIEILTETVELEIDETCINYAIHLADKTLEASINLTNCISIKSNVSTDIEFGFITDTHRVSLNKMDDLLEKMDDCVNDITSDFEEAIKCLSENQKEVLSLNYTIDEAVSDHLGKIKDQFAKAVKSFDFCKKEYGNENYSKTIIQPIVGKIARCFHAADDRRHTREVPPVLPNEKPLPSSAPIPIQRQKNLQEKHDNRDSFAVE